jgi:agmatine/peptidylarginine deiminase
MAAALVLAALVATSLLTGAQALAQTLTDPRAMAEWEELDGVFIIWYEEHYLEIFEHVRISGWTLPLRSEYEALMASQTAMIATVLDEEIRVFVPDDTTNTYQVPDTLASLGLSSPNLEVLPYDRNDHWVNLWIRDSGPFNVYKDLSDSLYVVGWQKNTDTPFVAGALEIPGIHLPEGSSSFCDGGNYMTDGHGKLFCDDWHDTSSPYQQTFNDRFGIDEFIDLPAYRGHIDYYMKLVNEETLFVSEIPFENYIGIESSYDDSLYLTRAIEVVQENAVSCYGRPYEVVRLRNAPSYDNTPLNLTYLTTDASYTNSLILNRTVMVPTFDHPATDTVAVRIYAQHMPGYRIVGVPSVYFAAMGGASHCLTKEIGAAEPVFIAHAWYPDSLDQVTDYPIYATIRTRSGVAAATVHWTADPQSGYEAVAMSPAGGDGFLAAIPGQPYDTRVHYYIEASAVSGKTMRKPIVAPDGAYSFLVHPDGASVGVRAELELPLAPGIQLGAATPNPFRQRTSVAISVPDGVPVTVRVYDVTGRMVSELLDRSVVTGGVRQVVAWHGRDQHGARATPGIYFIRLESPGESVTRKVVLAR